MQHDRRRRAGRIRPQDRQQRQRHLADRLRFNTLRDRITALLRTDRWQSMARSAVREDPYAALAALTFDVLAGSDPDARFEAWVHRNRATKLRRVR
ncbi:MAG TPA: hypothetical protein VEO01_01240, partial [Pseudonocardiaceae bacterium]|nr:hypothetical protein [Pseudonocardiaceae bacterium]